MLSDSMAEDTTNDIRRISPVARQAIDARDIPRIELGCGGAKMRPDAIGIDLLDQPAVDIVGDVFSALALLPESSTGEIFASHFVEHIEDLPRLIAECSRVLRPGGRIEFIVPHHANPYFYSDYTHRRAFGLYSMSYLVRDDILRRKVPTYGLSTDLTLVDVRLGFKSAFRYSIRNLVLRALGMAVNSARYLQELYEEVGSRLIPCYEVRFVCEKSKTQALHV
jgi:SAM-dependent methyltransferase